MCNIMNILTTKEVKEILTPLLPPGTIIHVSDKSYTTVGSKELKKLKKYLFILQLIPYRAETRDCDDFATIADAIRRIFCPSYAFGEIWADGISTGGGYHAMNFFITDEKKVCLFEPQNSKVITDFLVTGNNPTLCKI